MDVPDTMQAAYMTGRGPVEDISYGTLPTPDPGPDEVLVRVSAVALNPVDTVVRSGAYGTPLPFPFVLGRDLVGTVAAIAAGVTRFREGQWVWSNSLGHDGRQGAFADYACVPVERAYPLPAGIDPVTAVAALHPAATACTGLVHHAGVRPGETVFVGGAAGNVGSALVQLATSSGCRVLGSAGGEDDMRWCREQGADAVIDYRDPEPAARVRAVAPDGVDIHWDTSGHYDLDAAAEMLADGGRILLTAGAAARPPLPVGPLYWKNARVAGFVISKASVAQLAEAARMINEALATGTLLPRVTDVWPLSRSEEAHRRMEAGEIHGRVVLRPDGEG